jgi:hypothetical protein
VAAPLISYAAHTNNARNIASLRSYGWRLMLSPAYACRPVVGMGYALDNGAWSAYTTGRPAEWSAFRAMLRAHGPAADFVVAPDLVMGGAASLDLSIAWLEECRAHCPRVLIAVQPGMDRAAVRALLSPAVGVFVGGDTEWKIATMRAWADDARASGSWSHVGRVNTARRIALCAAAGVTSFDGSGPSRFSRIHRRLSLARDQLAIRF